MIRAGEGEGVYLPGSVAGREEGVHVCLRGSEVGREAVVAEEEDEGSHEGQKEGEEEGRRTAADFPDQLHAQSGELGEGGREEATVPKS